MPDYPTSPPYSPPPPPPGPQPLVSCPVAKSGMTAELAAQRVRYDEEVRDYWLYCHDRMIAPVLAAYVENVPPDESTECGRRAQELDTAALQWLAAADHHLLGNPPAAGTIALTQQCIDAIDCSATMYAWMQAVSQAQTALDAVTNYVGQKLAELQAMVQTWNQLFQDCPVPRPDQ